MHVTEMLKAMHSNSARYRACPQRMSARYRTASYGTAQHCGRMRICVDEWCRTSPYIDARGRTATCAV